MNSSSPIESLNPNYFRGGYLFQDTVTLPFFVGMRRCNLITVKKDKGREIRISQQTTNG